MAILHKNINNADDIHNPKWLPNANNGDYAFKNEKGELESIDELLLPGALNFVDGSVAPPTTATGDIYILSSGGSVNAGWGSVALQDWVRYDGTAWNSLTPQKSSLCYDKTADSLKFFDGSAWAAIGGGGGGGGNTIYTADDSLTGNRVVDQNSNTLSFTNSNGFLVNSNTKVNVEKVSLQGITVIKGDNTLSSVSALQIYDGDSTPAVLWDFRNNGDIIQGSADINHDLTGNKRINFLGGRVKIDVVASSGTFEFHKNSTKFLEINGNIDLFQSNFKRFRNSANQNFFIDFANTTTVCDAQWYSTGTVLTHSIRTGSSQRAHFNLNGSGTFIAGGSVNMPNLPTSASGLSSGDVYNDSGTLKIV